MTAPAVQTQTSAGAKRDDVAPWSRSDSVLTAAWMIVAMIARAPLTARIEGILDHDQSIVGLMALDIAAGRRFPIFFDGQRYMGAIEAYVAALFVALFGHSPVTVALSPLVFFGLFVAGQYGFWRSSCDRFTGHLAALITVLGAPMVVLWSVVPRGGYVEMMTWAVPVLAIYRRVTRPERAPLTRWRQFGWGFLFAFGYFVNPLSLIIYVTLAVDWTFGRHGNELRVLRRIDARWLDSRWAAVVWIGLGWLFIVALAVCCHVEFQQGTRSPFMFVMGWLDDGPGRLIGSLGLAVILAAAAWYFGVATRVWQTLPSHPWFALGALCSLVPFLAYNVCVLYGVMPFVQSLPIWIRPPWRIADNLCDGATALGPLVGCDPHGVATVLVGQGVEFPPVVWPTVVRALEWLNPIVLATVAALIAWGAWCDREGWKRFWSLRGQEPTRATILALVGLAVAALLYTLQATSPDSSSIRYLAPVWIFIPGLLASALRHLSRPLRFAAAIMLLVPWTAAQVNLWREIDRPSPLRPLAIELERRGIVGIVADTPVALMVANLTHGEVGALEFHSKWPRLGNRYLDRVVAGPPVICVVDRQLEWRPGEAPSGIPIKNIGPELETLATKNPARVRLAFRVAQFDTWEVDLPLAEILPPDEMALLVPPRPAKVSGARSGVP